LNLNNNNYNENKNENKKINEACYNENYINNEKQNEIKNMYSKTIDENEKNNINDIKTGKLQLYIIYFDFS